MSSEVHFYWYPAGSVAQGRIKLAPAQRIRSGGGDEFPSSTAFFGAYRSIVGPSTPVLGEGTGSIPIRRLRTH
jgi:hypothetical protein